MKRRKNPGICLPLLMIALLQLSWFPLWGLDPGKTVDQYLVDQWETTDGIPSNLVKTIIQTPDGYLWIASDKGLVRFDGMKFSTVAFLGKANGNNRHTPIPDTLYLDSGRKLWIGSAGAITSYDCQKRRFKTYTTAEGLTDDNIRRFGEDMKGNLWISFDSSYVNRFSPANEEITAFNDSHGLGGKKINAIVEDRNGNLLFGTRENGIFSFRDGKFIKYPVPGLEGYLSTIREDRNGILWIGTNSGLLTILDGMVEKYTTRNGLSDNYITEILEDSQGNFWLATVKGLDRVKKRQTGTLTFENVLNTYNVFGLFEDREGSIWAGTYDAGLRRLKDRKFTSYKPLEEYEEEILFSMFMDRHGDTWVGTVSGKLLRFRDNMCIRSLDFPAAPGTGIAAIAEDAGGNLWIGTNGSGVFKETNGTFAQFTTDQGLSDNLVTSIYNDSRGNSWFGTFDGVSVFHRENETIESLHSRGGLSGKKVHNVYEDKDQNIWIAADKGITVLKNGKIEKKITEYYLASTSVTCIYEDPSPPDGESDIFWIATQGDGLKRLRLKDKMVTTYKKTQGMAGNSIYQFFEDNRENFWLMSDAGVLRVRKSELNRFAHGEESTVQCISYGIADGMKSSEFSNEFSRNSSFKTKNGELWFLTKKGISIVNPAKISINKEPPPVVIEALFFNQQNIPLPFNAEKHKFIGNGDVTFHFTALSFLSPEKIRFKFRLKGVDNEWIFLTPGSERVVHYPDLEPGIYTFGITACNAEGVWTPNGNSITFTIEPSFSQSVFSILIPLFVIFVLMSGVFFTLRYFKRKTPSVEIGDEVEVEEINEDETVIEEEPEKKEKEEDKEKKDTNVKHKGSSLTPLFVEESVKRLMHLIDVEKVYRDETISLRSLAEKLSIPYYQLSKILNEKLDRSFPDFINYYRIKEAKEKLKDSDGTELKITALAYQVGYKSITAFYKAFKKDTGMKPTQYQKECQNKK